MATPRSRTAGTRGRAAANDGAAANARSNLWTGALRFEVYEENSGRHRWQLVTSDGREFATSCDSFATHDEAQRAVAEDGH